MFHFRPQLSSFENRTVPAVLTPMGGDPHGAHPGRYAEADGFGVVVEGTRRSGEEVPELSGTRRAGEELPELTGGGVWVGPSLNRNAGEEIPSKPQAVKPPPPPELGVSRSRGDEIPQ